MWGGREDGGLTAVSPEENIDAEARKKRASRIDVDYDLERIDIGRSTGTALAKLGRSQGLSAGRNNAGEIAARKSIRAHDNGLPDTNLADIALLDFSAHAQGRNVADNHEHLFGRGRYSFTDARVDLQDDAVARSANAGPLEGLLRK